MTWRSAHPVWVLEVHVCVYMCYILARDASKGIDSVELDDQVGAW